MDAVTFCVVSRNDNDIIGNCLNSIAEQNYPKQLVDVVVVDRESSDGSAEIIDNYSKRLRMKIVRQKCTRGAGRNIAAKNAKGKYIAIVEPLAILDRYWLSNAAKVLSNKSSEGVISTPVPAGVRGILAYASHFVAGPAEAVIYPKKLYEKLGGHAEIKWAEEMEMHNKIKASGKKISYSDNVRHTRGRTNNLSAFISHHFNRGYAYAKLPKKGMKVSDISGGERSFITSAAVVFLKGVKSFAGTLGYVYATLGGKL